MTVRSNSSINVSSPVVGKGHASLHLSRVHVEKHAPILRFVLVQVLSGILFNAQK